MVTCGGRKGVKPGVAMDWPKYLPKNLFSCNNNTEQKDNIARYLREEKLQAPHSKKLLPSVSSYQVCFAQAG